ncbi:MAG: HAD family hydrolase [Ktedonobacterales bacterium]
MAIPPGEAHSITLPIVFILDCDNTLLDNDTLKADMDRRLGEQFGEETRARFWAVYEAVREETGTVDLPLTFERLRPSLPDEQTFEQLRAVIMDYPFETQLYPNTLATLRHLHAIGLPVIVSDGDSSYQPRKIDRSGLADAVDNQVIIYIHKEEHLAEIQTRWPASFYVLVDDKPRILAETKRLRPDRFVTVLVRQGHYASAGSEGPYTPTPDIILDSIGELRQLDVTTLERHLAR